MCCPCNGAALLHVPEEEPQQGLALGHACSLCSVSVGDSEPQSQHPSPWGRLHALCPAWALLTPAAGQPALTVQHPALHQRPALCTAGWDAWGLPGEGEMSNAVVSSGWLPVRQKNRTRVAPQGRTTFYQVSGKPLAHTGLWWYQCSSPLLG